MEFSDLEVQQIVNAVLCLGDKEQGLLKYVSGDDYIQKSITIAKLASEIKRETGTVDMATLGIRCYR